MTHIEKVKKLAAEKKITVLDLNELLRLEVDRHLSDVEFYDSGTANVYIPITFDVDSAFGFMESALQMPSSRNANWRVESHDAK